MEKILSLLCILIVKMAAGVALAQNVGIGTTSPAARLHIAGTLKVADGTQGAGKILTSDATGLASWQTPSMPSSTYYPSVTICCQSWMTKNLDVSTYRNGDPIPHVADAAEWAALTMGAYCYYNNDSATYAATYGKLYNGHAINDPRGLAPEGWHIPTQYEVFTLGYTCLGGYDDAGQYLKEMGSAHWPAPNNSGNWTNFTALPGGLRWPNGWLFEDIGNWGYWWCSSNGDPYNSMYALSSAQFFVECCWNRKFGFSVRCIRD